MATFNKFDSFVKAMAEKVHNLGSDVIKMMLTNTSPVRTNTVKANITEITAGNGYPAGGVQAVQTSSTQTTGIYKLVLNDTVITSTGTIGPFQYVVLYNDTATNKELIGWFDYGAPITLQNTEPLTLRQDLINGVLTFQ
jgi:hypothetical protein